MPPWMPILCWLPLVAAAWAPSSLPLVAQKHVTAADRAPIPSAGRAPTPTMVLPKAVAFVFFLPWTFTIVVNNLPEEQRLRIQKQALFQGGAKLKVMKKGQRPMVKGVRLTQEVEAITSTFKKQYERRELELLWGALLKCYGDRELALQACRDNPQVINPSYSFCNTMIESKRALTAVMSADEALEVMRRNPAVLQCGPSLEILGASEIKGFAALRSAGNRLIPAPARGPTVAALVAAVAFTIAASQQGDAAPPELLPVLEVLRPLLGVVFGSVFAFAAYASGR